MIDLLETFVRVCREQFQFLVDEFGCQVAVSHRKEAWYSASVIFQNTTTAVDIQCDLRDNALNTVLMRLIDGRLPAYMDLDNTQGLWTVLHLRGGPRFPHGEIGTVEVIEHVLTQQAAAVRTYARDILEGDFSIFPELKRIMLAEYGPALASGGKSGEDTS
jgi:hypothetical protein